MSPGGTGSAIEWAPGEAAQRAAVDAAVARAGAEGWPARLWSRDDRLWGDDPAHRAVARNRLGWLDAPARLRDRRAELEALAAAAAAEGRTRALLLGMGGSSLAPEVLARVFGTRPGRLELAVLDNTSPAAVRAAAAWAAPRTTLFVVASKSGGTIEVASFEAHFFDRARAALGEAAGRAFVAITDPGSPLEALARRRGYRATVTAPPDVGGRYSALTEFGMLPAALLGADLAALADAGTAEAAASGPGVPVAASPAALLGVALGALARAGRDKLTLALGPGLEPLGPWIEQLVAESTGKQGLGILPVEGEPLAAPAAYGGDRVFVSVSIGPPARETGAALDALAAAGHPLLRWTLPGREALGGEFLRWEIATALAGAVLGVDPFDEPNVTEAKQATQAVLERRAREGRFPDPVVVARDGAVLLEAPAGVAGALSAAAGDAAAPAGWIAALLGAARPGDYVAVLAYLHADAGVRGALEALRAALRARGRFATTLGIGPRFLHSTGQLHKGGPDTGIFLQLTADEGPDEPIPGAPYGFESLRWAQAAGDYEVLERRGRRVVRLRLGADPAGAIRALAGALAAPARA